MIQTHSFTRKCLYDVILVTILFSGRSVRHCQRAYLRLGRSCFTGIRPYATEKMDKFLLDEFGAETAINEVDFPK